MPGHSIPGIPLQRFFQVCQGRLKIAPLTIDPGECKIAAVLPGCIPDALIKCIIGFIQPILHHQAQSEIIIRLPVIRVGIPLGQPGDGGAEVAFAGSTLSPPAQQQSVGIIAADIPWISFQRLQIIRVRFIGSMPVLLKVEAGKV